MESRFDVIFPLVLDWGGSVCLTFTVDGRDRLTFTEGIYYLRGDNGSGKTTFINILSLTAGCIGKGSGPGPGTVIFNGIAYNGGGFDYMNAADIRETHFCIFPQKAFFLPVSTRENYLILNGSDPGKAASFSPSQHPDLLSGGQQQKVLMDIVLDEKRPVWFLDEPLTNLDAERQRYFWQVLKKAYEKEPRTIFFIDHWMNDQIEQDRQFERYASLNVAMENPRSIRTQDRECKQIDIYANRSPEAFLNHQIQKTEKEKNHAHC